MADVSSCYMDEEKSNEEDFKEESWWQQGLTLFAEVSSWIVAPIILALIFGKMLDKHFDTSPWIFLSLTGVSFFVSCYGIYRIVIGYIRGLQNKDEEEK